MTALLLASSSPYRRQLLDKLGLNYTWQAPDINETCLPYELPEEVVKRLAHSKAQALAHNHPDKLIIGSDQVAVIDNKILGKPLNHEHATGQLTRASGKKVIFFTGLCLLNTATGRAQLACETFTVYFRNLNKSQIENYLRKEQPYDCAGSFKSEGLGITLFDRLDGRDPNTLVGLPLIALTDMLMVEGLSPLGD